MSVKVLHLYLDGYRGWKTVKLTEITLPEFSIPAVIQYYCDLHELEEKCDFPKKSDLKLSCGGRVINYMGEEVGDQFILLS